MTREEKLSRDISAINKSLQSISEDLRYFRKKDEGAPMYTCKDCTQYRSVYMDMGETDGKVHWCELLGCTISDDGLTKTCAEFEKDGEF